MSKFENNVSAIVYAILQGHGAVDMPGSEKNDVVRKVLLHFHRAPWHFRPPIRILTRLLDWQCVVLHSRGIRRLDAPVRWGRLKRWRSSRIGPCRDLMKFFETLVLISLYSWEERKLVQP